MNETKLHDLIEKMTLEEKAAQMSQVVSSFIHKGSSDEKITGPFAGMEVANEDMTGSGSVLGATGADNLRTIQKAYLERSRLGIPLLFMADVIHGYKTVFPVPLALGCTWDPKAVEESAAIAAKESAAAGLHVTFSPMVDLVRDPRWGRVMESTGEDPYLNGVLARALVRGYQGDDLKNDQSKLAACVKHFAAYGAPEGGRDYNTVDMSRRQLMEYYLPAYEAALDEGAELVMTAFNTVEGIPATSNKWLMRDLLRKEMGFDGVLISDWGAVQEAIPHGVAADNRDAALKAVTAGLDIEMMTPCYVQHLKTLVEENVISEALLDEAVLRILKLKNKLGLFENPYRGADTELEETVMLSETHRKAARETAAKSCVLLKNEGVLPLRKSQNVALIGPFAESTDLMGPWSIFGEEKDVVSVRTGMTEKLDTEPAVEKGCDIEAVLPEQLEAAVEAAKQAEVVVLALGEHSEMSGEAGSRTNIKLPDAQLQLVAEVKKLGKPLVTVLFNGRPLDLHGVVDESNAVLEAWYPGTEAGHAVADLLFGDTNPSGKLTMSFPHNVGQVPVYYNSFNTGRPKDQIDPEDRFASKYLDAPNGPLFPFGFGLSYTTFTYSSLALSSEVMEENGTIRVSVNVQNTGAVAGEETVQMYVRDLVGEVVRPVKELKGFSKIHLEPGETKQVVFEVDEESLKYHHSDLTYTCDAGEFIVSVGPDSRNTEEGRFSYSPAGRSGQE
ncbi:glycoside hydrolase family 3 N-terminal domain-containing protein [Alteribacter keqinensis]|uniref:beta-glucosidase n=1 Tax=Alteribacter keqinensis TaxID=2483800 RepID=A0A3M7TPW9_9BACI|nr:glycoside hydrolase family 3 N-terminal domain-containing protein [Alteribacter keqinensis]RNA67684.1 beta-glucosidase [Alteribacter keqinensis]